MTIVEIQRGLRENDDQYRKQDCEAFNGLLRASLDSLSRIEDAERAEARATMLESDQ